MNERTECRLRDATGYFCRVIRALIKTNGHERYSNFMHCYAINIERPSRSMSARARTSALISEIRAARKKTALCCTRKLRFHSDCAPTSRARASASVVKRRCSFGSRCTRPNALPSIPMHLLCSRERETRTVLYRRYCEKSERAEISSAIFRLAENQIARYYLNV